MTPDQLARFSDAGVRILAPESTYIDDAVVLEPGCTLHPHVFLRGATVLHRNAIVEHGSDVTDSEIGEDSIVRPFTTIGSSSLGPNCTVGPYAELRDSRLGANCQFGSYSLSRHFECGDTVKVVSHCFLTNITIGDAVRISSGVVTHNYDGHMKHRVQVGSRVFIAGGAHLIAPLTIGTGAYVASASIIREDVPAGALAINEAKQRIIEGWTERKGKDGLPPSQPTPVDTRRKQSRYYRARREEFRQLIDRDGAAEEEYQRFLEDNYWILGSYEDRTSKPRAGARHVPDFVMERIDGQFEVVEIKTPRASLFVRQDGRLVESAELKRALAQLMDYLAYYGDHYLSESKIQAKDFRVAAGKLVIGRTASAEDRERLRQLNEHYLRISIQTYDDLLANAASVIKLVEREDAL
jgi:serine acetyltransferase